MDYKKAFTIVELLVVIVVIGILATIAFVSYSGVQQRAVAATIKSDLTNNSRKLDMFLVENSTFPGSITDCPTPATGNICLNLKSDFTYNYYSINDPSSKSYCFDMSKSGISYRYVNGINSAPGDCSTYNGLVAYYPLDENALDYSGNGNNGRVVGAVNTSSGKIGGAYDFNGASYIDLGTKSVMKSQNMTISAWVKADTLSTWSGIISNMPSWGTGFSMQIGNTQKVALMASGNYHTTTWSPATGTWYHIVGTHESGTNATKIYVNNVLENTSTYSISFVANASTYLGVFYTAGPSLYLDGLIDDVRIYNRVLSAGEIGVLYGMGS